MRRPTPLFMATMFLLAALLAYTAYRACALSMTHDESVSFLWFQNIDVLSCFFEKSCWPTANNHLLNTWAWQQSMRLFGISEWALRLPNVLAHLIYLLCSLGIILAVTRRFWIALAGIALLNFNPYLLDFFSLARGYGLSVGLCMGSLYAFMAFFRHGRWPALLASYLLAALAVLANFVAFNFLASLWGAMFIMSLIQEKTGTISFRFRWRQQLRMNAIPLVIGLVLALLLYRPIRYLQEAKEFHYGAERLWMTFRSIVQSSLYDNRYFAADTLWIFFLFYGILISLALAGAFWFYYRKPEEAWRKQYLATALLFLTSCIVMAAQHYLLGSNYLEGRKALHFIPLSGLLFFFMLYGVCSAHLNGWAAKLGAGLCLLLPAYHLGRSFNLSHCYEWRFDQSTRDMVKYLDAQITPGQAPATMGAYWMFQPTATFYHQVLGIRSFAAPPFVGGDTLNPGPDFFYLFESQAPQLEGRYTVLKKFSGGMVLMRRK